MATASKKTKSKRLPLAKTRPKRKGSSKPLLAVSATVRKSKPRNKARRSLAVVLPTIPIAPAFALLDYMGRVMGAYAELPVRLAQCRSPMDLWLEQTRFAQRIFSAYQSTPPSERPSARW
jgi:hypothetical protein